MADHDRELQKMREASHALFLEQQQAADRAERLAKGQEVVDRFRDRAEAVNHPSHYGGDTVYETIKVLFAWGLDKDFCLGNCVKYISRAGKKDPTKLLEDLRKAAFYLNYRIQEIEKGDK